MSTARRLVVTGATGKQGGALIAALLTKPSQPFEIYAVTRNRNSRGAQALASKPNVHVLEGDFKDPNAIFQQVKNPWGLFSVTNPMPGAKLEEQQGKAMHKAAFDAGVKHIVLAATDRGGQKESDTNSTNIPHFASKFNMEQDIMEKAKTNGTTWTFLRPVAFFENMGNNFFGRAFVAMWRINGYDTKLQMISGTDVGRVAAEAFMNFDSDEYRNKAISLAGDDLSPNEAAKIFQDTVGQEMPWTYSFIGSILRWILKEQLGLMFDWFKASGFRVDVPVIRRRYPFIKDFRTWLAEESAWKRA